jgi:hypothetical protein
MTLLLLVGAAACGPDAGEFTRAKLMQAVQTSPNRLDLREYVKGDWDRVCFFMGPMSARTVQATLGFAWPDALDTGIEKARQETLAVFTKGYDVVHSVMLDRYRGDFNANAPSYCVAKNNAVFRVTNPQATAFRALVPLEVGDVKEPPPVDPVQIMVAAARWSRVVGGNGLIDPRTPNASQVASQLGMKMGMTQEAIVCTDPENARTCRWQYSLVARLNAPVARDSLQAVRMSVLRPSRDEYWRAAEDEYEIVLAWKYDRWTLVERRVIREGR